MLDAIGVASSTSCSPPSRSACDSAARSTCRRACPRRRSTPSLRVLAARNASTEDEVSFLGAGCTTTTCRPGRFDHPRAEFLTPYTPYQPEISQGGLQAASVPRPRSAELTGLPVIELSRLRGPVLASPPRPTSPSCDDRRGGTSSSRGGVHPHARETLATTRGRLGHRRTGGRRSPTASPRSADRSARPPTPPPCSSSSPTSTARSSPRGQQGRSTDAAHAAGASPRCWSCATDPLTLGVLAAPAGLRRRRLPWGRDRRSATGSTTAAPPSGSSPRSRPTCAACRAASPARPPTSTAAAASCSRCRRASSTSAARRPPQHLHRAGA